MKPIINPSYFGSALQVRTVSMILLLLSVQVKRSRANDGGDLAGANPSVENSTSPAVDNPHFFIQEFRVTGENRKLLSNSEIGAAVYPFLGPYRDADDVESARSALERVYQDKGYQTVSVETPKEIKKGVVIFHVVAGVIGRVRVVGSRFFLPSEIRSEAPSLTPGKIPNFDNVTKDLLDLNQLADRHITPAMKAGSTPGVLDVDLNVKDTFPFHGSLEVNNRYSSDTSPLRLDATVSYDNLWQLGHSLNLTYQIAPENPKDAKVYEGSYLARIPNNPALSFLIYGLKSDSNVASLGDTNVLGRGDTIGGRAIINLPAAFESKGFDHSISFGIDYKKSLNQTLNNEIAQVGQMIGVNLKPVPPVIYFPLNATYTANWLFDDGSKTILEAGGTFCLDGLSSDPAVFDQNRYRSSGSFAYFRGDLSHTQELPLGMQLYGKIQASVSDEALITSEEFSAGGLDTVRGYLESEALGDNGAIGQFEIRSPTLGKLIGYPSLDWRFFAFGDSSYLTLNNALPEQTSSYELASFGGGTFLTVFDHFNGSIVFGVPLTDGPFTQSFNPLMTFRVWTTF